MKKYFLFAALLVVVALALAACGGGGGSEGPIKIGALFDLTGPTADVGTPYANGEKGFVEWLNANGGVNGRKVELVGQDYAYKVDQAEQLYSQYVNQDKVVAFLGWGTGDTEALRGKIAQDKIPFMSASYSINLASPNEAPYNFLMGTTYSDQMVIALKWVLEDAQKKGVDPKVVVFHHDSPFGKSPVPDGQKFADENGIAYTNIAMPKGATDLTPQLTQAQDFGVNYVVIQNVSSGAALLLKNAKNLGMTDNVQFICLNWCADELFIKLAEGASDGVLGVMPFTSDFSVPGAQDPKKFLESKGDSLDNQGLHYVQGWWTAAAMVEGIKRTLDAKKDINDGANIKATLEAMKDYSTGDVTAPISFSSTDHRGNDKAKIHQVQGGKWVPITDFMQSRIPLQ